MESHDGVVFRVLGPLEIRRGDHPLPVPAGKPRILLAHLLLRANQTVATDELIDVIWTGTPPVSALANVRTYVAGLRRSLGAAAAALRAHPAGYHLDVRPGQLDLDVFRGLVRVGRAALAARQPRTAADVLDRAYRLWRGGALQDVATGSGLAGRAAQLDEERRTVLEDLAQALLALGRAGTVVSLLRQHLDDHPLRERAAALLMTALYRYGDPAAALAVFTAARQALAEQLGLEPARQLVALQRAVLTRDPALDGPRPRDRHRPTATAARQLPPAPGTLVGRERELARITATATRHGTRPSVIAIHGAAGVGKSAVAVAAAHTMADMFPDAQLYLRLDGNGRRRQGAVTAGEALNWLLRGLAVPAQDVPDDPEQAAALLRSTLASRRALILLDDAAGIDQISPLIPAGGPCLLLVTSRRMLAGLDSAVQVGLDLPTPAEAVSLLSALVGADRVAAEPAAAEAVSRYCGYLPLALRVAAARVGRWADKPLARLATRLIDERRRLDVLQLDDVGVRLALRDSYRPLLNSVDPTDRLAADTFRRCGLVTAPWFTTQTIAALLRQPMTEVAAAVDRLVDLRLLEPVGSDSVRMHDLVRLFAAEQAVGTASVATEQAYGRS